MLNPIVFIYLFIFSMISFEAAAECDISGFWNHSTKPVQLFVDLSKGEISVYSHEDNAEAVGLVVLKSVQAGSTLFSWYALMYSATKDSFVDVEIASTTCNELTVRFNGEEILELFR